MPDRVQAEKEGLEKGKRSRSRWKPSLPGQGREWPGGSSFEESYAAPRAPQGARRGAN